MASNHPLSQSTSMIGAHVQYAKGYVEETIGSVTGSKEWTGSGKKDEQEGIDAMRAAKRNDHSEPGASALGGKLEQQVGKAVGCEGLEEEGKVRSGKAMDEAKK